jgi:zinc transporter
MNASIDSSTVEQEGLIAAWLLDGKGGGRQLGWDDINDIRLADKEFLWYHFDYSQQHVQQWMQQSSELPELVVEALLQTETRPRCVAQDNGLMIFLRGVNLNPGADPEDMVSMRMWGSEHRIISLRMRRMMSFDSIRDAITRGAGPTTPGEFIVMLVEKLLDRVSEVIEELYDQVDELENSMLIATNEELRYQLTDIRQQAIALRRFLAPQREALNRLSVERSAIFSDENRLHLREDSDRLTRLVEDLDAARERSTVIHESLVGRLAEQTNHRMYVLSIIAAIFLPLSFATGLLGINVGGIPGAESPLGFVVTVVLMAGIAAGLWAFFRWRHWF